MECIQELELEERLLTLEHDALGHKLMTLRSKLFLLKQFRQAKTVTTEPGNFFNSKSGATPEQTATGKESTNPLMAITLPKGKEVVIASISKVATATSKLVGLPTLRIPNRFSPLETLKDSPLESDVPRFVPNYKQAVEKDLHKCYYVIYGGKDEGIFTDWGEVSSLVTGTSATCKKYSSLQEARRAKDAYDLARDKAGIIKRPMVKRKASSPHVDTDEIFKQKNQKSEFEGCDPTEFRALWSKARIADQDDLATEKFFTDDKQTRSLFNFVEGASPELVYQAFKAGLVKNIYPSANLHELKCFPKEMVKAIKNFRTKILKASDQPLYLNVTSSIPDWEQATIFCPYYFMEIGLAKNKEFSEPKAMDETFPAFTEITRFRAAGLTLISNKLLAINTESRLKVNFCNSHCLLTSWCKNTISNEDIRLLARMEIDLRKNNIDVAPATKIIFCNNAQRLFEDHICQFCLDIDVKQDCDTNGGSPSKTSSHGSKSRTPSRTLSPLTNGETSGAHGFSNTFEDSGEQHDTTTSKLTKQVIDHSGLYIEDERA